MCPLQALLTLLTKDHCPKVYPFDSAIPIQSNARRKAGSFYFCGELEKGHYIVAKQNIIDFVYEARGS